ncbi:DUF2750 domain-containing protein [Oceanospirillum linum]|uniref:DUF2750 domain-containing protein n=1 Tax=Oceanospirillum linum TaxID=966 RepID=A0A1T1H9T5_OCELI|nr:DUF2750 domain-containing protein [Oceanospirillum linum]OOV86575.1 hypothetical protein BTA35_0211730 [Oceanospirillum linum]SEG29530.1 Protein of unknown function [Oleiphilus messinensis]SMP26286.1 Protein of unknown function [Oceanospirillum linum]
MTRLTDNIDDNYSLFIEEIRFNGELWGIESEDGWVVVDSQEFEDTDVIPFWSEKEDAEAHCVEEWADYQISKVEIESFVQEWLPELDSDGVLVGANWNTELDGLEVEPLQLAEALAGVDAD